MKNIRVGMIGTGYMAKLHSLSFLNVPKYLGSDTTARFDLVRQVGRNGEKAASEAKRWGWAESGTDWKSVTRDPDIDLVDVATDNDTHEEICEDAFAHGKDVICEKPL